MKSQWDRRKVLKSLGALALYSPVLHGGQHNTLELNGATMGTRYRISIQNRPEVSNVPKLKTRIHRELLLTELLMSGYRKDSELSRFNLSTDISWQKISPATSRVLKESLLVQQQSGGAFNPLAAPLFKFWGFGPDAKANRQKNHRNIPDRLLADLSSSRIELKPGLVRKSNPDSGLDLNAIAKGDALDQIALILEDTDIHNYLIEVGGEIRVAGEGPGNMGWRIGIDHPFTRSFRMHLKQGAIATSGDYINYYMQGEKRISHLLDPRHGGPVSHNLSLVTVFGATAMHADAWATALYVLGPDKGWSTALERSIAALFILREGDGFSMQMTPEFQRLRLEAGVV
jgi:thiamine biosynthesis lipoprotein